MPEMKNTCSSHRRLLSVLMLAAVMAIFGGVLPAAAAPGDNIADLTTPEGAMVWPLGIAKAIAMDGKYLYYAEYSGSVIHRVDVPPPGASNATGHIDIPIVGAPGGVMTIAYDGGRDLFWAVSGDGTAIYQITKGGIATRQFTIDTVNGLPGNCKNSCSNEVKIAYDRSDDSIWYSPDTTKRVYHFQATGDMLGRAVLATVNPYVDVDVAPNTFAPECGSNYVSGIASGGSGLFFEISNCNYYFEFTKAGVKVGATPHSPLTSGGLACDNVSYSVSVIWMRLGWDPHIYAVEQPRANACVYGG
jgi:hypothetical protein